MVAFLVGVVLGGSGAVALVLSYSEMGDGAGAADVLCNRWYGRWARRAPRPGRLVS